jgi:EAL domain-containing protein (putative c-di-GMP-specific phosphodiesterase class I)
VSAAQLRDAGLVAQVASVLEAHGLPGEALELELTETMLVEEPALAAERLDALRALGVRIALDDFGVGYSSLSYLLRFPIDVLKIDRGFIQRMHAEPGAEALVVTMVELGARLGIAVVAEGVEDAAWTARLRALGCDEAQGFALARPMPEAEAEAWLRQALRPSAPAAQPHLE